MPVGARSATAGVLLLAAGCAGPPSASLAWDDAWEALIATRDGTVLVVRVAQGNTGLLRGEARIEVSALPPAGSPVVLRRRAAPADVGRDTEARVVRLASDRVTHGEGTWAVAVREGPDALDATVRLSALAKPVEPVALDEGRRQRTLGVPMPLAGAGGVWRSGSQGGVIDGRAVLMRESGDAWPDGRTARESLYVLGRERGAGVEILCDRSLAWTAGPAETRTGRTARIAREDRRLVVTVGPDLGLEATVRLDRASLVSAPWDDLSLIERPIAGLLAGWPVRVVERGEATVREPGMEPWTATAVHVVRAGPSGRP